MEIISTFQKHIYYGYIYDSILRTAGVLWQHLTLIVWKVSVSWFRFLPNYWGIRSSHIFSLAKNLLMRQILATGRGHRRLAMDKILGEYVKGILRGLEGKIFLQPLISPQLGDLGGLNFFFWRASKGDEFWQNFSPLNWTGNEGGHVK